MSSSLCCPSSSLCSRNSSVYSVIYKIFLPFSILHHTHFAWFCPLGPIAIMDGASSTQAALHALHSHTISIAKDQVVTDLLPHCIRQFSVVLDTYDGRESPMFVCRPFDRSSLCLFRPHNNSTPDDAESEVVEERETEIIDLDSVPTLSASCDVINAQDDRCTNTFILCGIDDLDMGPAAESSFSVKVVIQLPVDEIVHDSRVTDGPCVMFLTEQTAYFVHPVADSALSSVDEDSHNVAWCSQTGRCWSMHVARLYGSPLSSTIDVNVNTNTCATHRSKSIAKPYFSYASLFFPTPTASGCPQLLNYASTKPNYTQNACPLVEFVCYVLVWTPKSHKIGRDAAFTTMEIADLLLEDIDQENEHENKEETDEELAMVHSYRMQSHTRYTRGEFREIMFDFAHMQPCNDIQSPSFHPLGDSSSSTTGFHQTQKTRKQKQKLPSNTRTKKLSVGDNASGDERGKAVLPGWWSVYRSIIPQAYLPLVSCVTSRGTPSVEVVSAQTHTLR